MLSDAHVRQTNLNRLNAYQCMEACCAIIWLQAVIIATACLFYIRQQGRLGPTQTIMKSSISAMSKTHELLFKKA